MIRGGDMVRVLIIISLLIIILMLGVNLTRAQQAPNANPPNQINLAQADNPWRTEYVDRSINPPQQVGYFPSLALRTSDDLPYISYYNLTDGDLMIAYRFPSTSCGLNWTCDQVNEPEAVTGQNTSADTWSDGELWKLGISYYDSSYRSLHMYLLSCDAFGCNSYYITVDTPAIPAEHVGHYTSLKFNPAGTPMIVYHINNYTGPDSLMYAYPVTSGGNCGEGEYFNQWNCLTIDSGEGIGRYASLDLSWNLQPYVAYYDAVNGDLKLAAFVITGGNCGTGNQWVCTVIDGQDGTNVGAYASLKAPGWDGAPLRIAYYDGINHKLKFYNSLAGSPMFVDDMGINELYKGLSLDIDKDGLAVIAYKQLVDGPAQQVLRLARPYLAYNDGSYGNCGDEVSGHLYWRCSTLDSGSATTRVADFASLAIDSHGLARIAYSELDSEFNIISLKYTYQTSTTFLPLLVRH